MRTFLSLLLVLVMAGCSAGPDTESLRAGVNDQLAMALPQETVELVSFERRGSQADINAPAGEARRVLYFDAQLKLTRDFNFGGWDGPGIAGLVSALGAGPKGISGIVSGGNKAGDVLRAHGTALYAQDGSHWVPVVTGGYRPPETPAYVVSDTLAPQGPAAILDAMRRVVDSVPKGASPAEQTVIEQELKVAYATIQARLARVNAGYAIAAGQEHGQYLRLASAFAEDARTRIVPLITHGGEENLRLLRDGKVSFALAQADAALDAYEGAGVFASEGPYTAIRAIGSLFPEAVHILVHADTPYRAVVDLRGRRIAIGEPGSASRTTALRVLHAHGLELADIIPRELDIGAALVALRNQEVDAVIQTIGVPADSVRDALTDIPVRLLPLSEHGISMLAGSQRGYFRYVISRGTYSNPQDDVPTIATAALLLAAANLSDAEIISVARFVYAKGQDFAARGSAQGTQISVATATLGLSVPQQLAAAKELDSMAMVGTAAEHSVDRKP